jgi:hypothetical protein
VTCDSPQGFQLQAARGRLDLKPPEFKLEKARIATKRKPAAAGGEFRPMATLNSRRWLQAFSSLASHDFRWFILSQLASTTANWMEIIVRSLIIYNLSGSAVVIGAVNVFRALRRLSWIRHLD